MPKAKNKTKKVRHKKEKTLIGFDNIPKTLKTIWANDQFGKRKVIDIEKYLIRSHIDNKGLATDYKNDKERFKFASSEYKRRLLLQLKLSPSSRKLFERKTKKKYNSKTIQSKIEKMPITKVQKLYFFLLNKQKTKKLRKK